MMSSRQAPSEQWQLEGRSAEAYERYLVPKMFAPWAQQLLDLADLHPGEQVLDVACGTGIVARYAASRVGTDGSVVGLDINEGMLEVAKSRAAGVRSSIAWQQANATDMPFPDGSFDVVFCQQALQFFSDPAAALQEMHRVLNGGGRLAVSVWRPLEHNPSYMAAADVLERHLGKEAAAVMRSPFPSWDLETLRELIQQAGLEAVQLRIGIESTRYPSPEEFLRREAASSPLASSLGALSEKARAALIEEVGYALKEHTDDEGVIFPMETHLAAAQH